MSFQVLDSVTTPIGVIDLRQRTLPDGSGRSVTEILIDGGMLMSSLCTVSEEALATRALAMHGGAGGLRVLVGGLGLGYTAWAALADPRVACVRVIDRLPEVIGWVREGLVPLSAELAGPLADGRMEIVLGDVYAGLLGPGDADWDLVLVDVDHCPTEPLDEASEPFYRWEGQRQVLEHLAPGGVLAVWSSGDDDDFADVLEEVWPVAERQYVSWVNPAIAEGDEVDEVLFLARKDEPE